MEGRENIILCIRMLDKVQVTPEARISECNFGCGQKVWVQPHNLLEKKICIHCLIKRRKELNINRIGFKPEDIKRAVEFINSESFVTEEVV